MSINSASASELKLILTHIADECARFSAIPSSQFGSIDNNKLGDVSQSLRESQSFNKTLAKYKKNEIFF